MTKVLESHLNRCVLGILLIVLSATANAVEGTTNKPAQSLYSQLGQVGLDPQRIFHVRDASIDRSAIHISLEDGTIGFTQDVMGRITGAFFVGDGEILLSPPDEVERKSMSLFTGMAILEERFSTAYFRFDRDVPEELRPDLRAADDDKQDFVDHYSGTMRNLASLDAMRLLVTFSSLLPSSETTPAKSKESDVPTKFSDRFLHARLQGLKLGVFDVYFDSSSIEKVLVGQAKTAENGQTYYDVWTSFSPMQSASSRSATGAPTSPPEALNQISIRSFKISTNVLPPKQIHAIATLQCRARNSDARLLLFELSRFLQIESVKLDGQSIEYIQNPALEGTELSRRGNDIVAIALPAPLKTGQDFQLQFAYGGEVLAGAGSGLLYVGARGTWYPNRGMEMANYDLQFRYPQGWTLVATGKPTEPLSETNNGNADDQRSRWVSERPIPVAGFNLGKYREATTRAEAVTVETYATRGVERDFPSAPIQVVIEPPPLQPAVRRPQVIAPPPPSPALREVAVGETAARAIEFFADRFGPFPYSRLALTQMPGRESQGWPGLVFLSSYAFLDDDQRRQLHFDPVKILLQESVPAHEVAHQWWGDLVMWSTYRDQWFSEGLANYCAMMMLQEHNPAGFRQLMDMYRLQLLEKNKDGMTPMDAGPVTLGTRLLSSRFPGGYEAISYGRGAWLFHMLRTMLKDTAEHKSAKAQSEDEPFVRALRKIAQNYDKKPITTRELLDAFSEELPPSLRYEGKRSLDWFLNGWINGTALPKLELKSVKVVAKGSRTVVTGTILQKDAPEDLVTSVPVYAVIQGRQLLLLGRVFADGEETSFHLSGPAGAHKIVLDPYDTVLSRPK
ncbi:MAG TPA: M1 family aminopeptidase [Candidatus Sulfotelmatobacter sp.]|nr:M1 family aminopeptidase [Candidatus Sulfotelmatobacter sp.]